MEQDAVWQSSHGEKIFGGWKGSQIFRCKLFLFIYLFIHRASASALCDKTLQIAALVSNIIIVIIQLEHKIHDKTHK